MEVVYAQVLFFQQISYLLFSWLNIGLSIIERMFKDMFNDIKQM